MLASEYAAKLLERVKIHGDYPVCITQSGYYAEGMFAELMEPESPEIVKEWNTKGGQLYYILGHSHQSY